MKKSAKIRKLYQHKMWEAKSLRLELYQGLELAEKTRLNEAYLNHCLHHQQIDP